MKKISKMHTSYNCGRNMNLNMNLSRLPSDILFFDIETTGFSPARSRLYLIGTAHMEDHAFAVTQYFAASPEEEPELLEVFSSLLKQNPNLCSFNGNGFDLPYLKGRYEQLGLEIPDMSQNSFYDIYKDLSAYRTVFGLQNMKQKTLEAFLGLEREDIYSGGELIEVYRTYQKTGDAALLQLLLQHNQEDLTGMAALLPLYAFPDFFAGDFQAEDAAVYPYRTVSGAAGEELLITCIPGRPLPACISCQNDRFYLHADAKKAVFRIPVYPGELKYFYPDYKDYYYLPAEDLAIHKSVAAYVDKGHRKKASAATCYTKKTGVFLPQEGEWITPAFYQEYRQPVSYFELTDAFLADKPQIRQYCMHILKILAN